jgi:hypothetical protein
MPEQQNTKDALSQWLMGARKLYGLPGSPIQLDHNFHWSIVNKMVQLRGCICAKGEPSVTTDEGGSAHWIHDADCGIPPSPADGGPAPIEGERP